MPVKVLNRDNFETDIQLLKFLLGFEMLPTKGGSCTFDFRQRTLSVCMCFISGIGEFIHVLNLAVAFQVLKRAQSWIALSIFAPPWRDLQWCTQHLTSAVAQGRNLHTSQVQLAHRVGGRFLVVGEWRAGDWAGIQQLHLIPTPFPRQHRELALHVPICLLGMHCLHRQCRTKQIHWSCSVTQVKGKSFPGPCGSTATVPNSCWMQYKPTGLPAPALRITLQVVFPPPQQNISSLFSPSQLLFCIQNIVYHFGFRCFS